MVDSPMEGMLYEWVWDLDKKHSKNAKIFKILALCLFLLAVGTNMNRIISGEIPNIFMMVAGLTLPVILYCLQSTRKKMRKSMWLNAINAYGLSEEERTILTNSYRLRFDEEPSSQGFRRGLYL